MALFSEDKSDRVQFALAQELLNKLFLGIIVIEKNHKIIYTNKAISDAVGYDAEFLKGMEIHSLLPPDFRDRHRQIVTAFFDMPLEIAIEQRPENMSSMNLVPKGTDDKPEQWLPVRIGIHPLFVDETQQMFQTGNLIQPLRFGLAEVALAKTYKPLKENG